MGTLLSCNYLCCWLLVPGKDLQSSKVTFRASFRNMGTSPEFHEELSTAGQAARRPRPTQTRRNHPRDLTPARKHPPSSDPTNWRMRSTGEGRQPSRGPSTCTAVSLGKAWLHRHQEEIPAAAYPAGILAEKQGKSAVPSPARFRFKSNFRFVSRFLSLPFTSGAFCGAAAGSCVRCRRPHGSPGEGLGHPGVLPAVMPRGWTTAALPSWGPQCRRPRRAGGCRWAPRAVLALVWRPGLRPWAARVAGAAALPSGLLAQG